MVAKMGLVKVDGTPFLSTQAFIDLGNLSFKQLANLRHRGAFSTVTLTFAKFCQASQLRMPERDSVAHLLAVWYQVRSPNHGDIPEAYNLKGKYQMHP